MTSDVGRLRRWEDSGATWQVIARGADGLVIALLTCDLGEEVDRLASADPDLIGYVGDRARSDEPPPGDPHHDHTPSDEPPPGDRPRDDRSRSGEPPPTEPPRDDRASSGEPPPGR